MVLVEEASLIHNVGFVYGSPTWSSDFCAAAAEIEATTGAVVHAFTTGTMVQVFRLASGIPADVWNGNGANK